MSIWIFRSGWPVSCAALLGATVLAGCTNGAIPFAAKERTTVAGNNVVIAGPPGYCVDTTATKDTGNGAFVLLGSCASVANNNRLANPANAGMLTASVSGENDAQISGAFDQLESFFRSSNGRAALARDGKAGSVRILETRKKNDAFYVRARDTSKNTIAGISQDYWRGLFDVNGRIVTVSVVGFETRPMSGAAGLATLDAFTVRIQQDNARQHSAENAG